MAFPSERCFSLVEHFLIVQVYRNRGLAVSIHFLSLEAGVRRFWGPWWAFSFHPPSYQCGYELSLSLDNFGSELDRKYKHILETLNQHSESLCTQAWNSAGGTILPSHQNWVRNFKLSEQTLCRGAESSECVVRMLEIALLREVPCQQRLVGRTSLMLESQEQLRNTLFCCGACVFSSFEAGEMR